MVYLWQPLSTPDLPGGADYREATRPPPSPLHAGNDFISSILCPAAEEEQFLLQMPAPHNCTSCCLSRSPREFRCTQRPGDTLHCSSSKIAVSAQEVMFVST